MAFCFLIAGCAMLLLSPVQVPWYFIWVAPFLCVFPYRGLLLMTLTFPLYYAFFKLTAADVDEAWLLGLVWAMWLPVWTVIAVDWWTGKKLEPDIPDVQRHRDAARHEKTRSDTN